MNLSLRILLYIGDWKIYKYTSMCSSYFVLMLKLRINFPTQITDDSFGANKWRRGCASYDSSKGARVSRHRTGLDDHLSFICPFIS